MEIESIESRTFLSAGPSQRVAIARGAGSAMNAIRSFAAMLVAISLAGCSSYTVRKPAENASLPAGPVNFAIDWTGGQMKNFTATLDGVDVAGQFTVGSSNATATLPVAGGQHTFVTTADVYDPFYRKDIGRSSTIPFSVATPAPGINLSVPSDAQASRGGMAMVTVTVARSGGFAGPVKIDASGPALTAPSSATIAAADATTTLSLNVKANAPFGVSTVQISGSGTGVQSQSKPVSLRVLRGTGAFGVASFAVTTGGDTATSPDGAITLLARTGAQEALPSAYAAVFRRGAMTIGSPIGYNHGATNQQGVAYGGAGFDAASAAGFVISGRGGGVTTSQQFAVFFLDLATGRLAPQADVASFRFAYYFEPRVWFSPDGSVAIAVGAHPTGPSNNLAQVIDVARAATLGSFEFNAPTFSASVATTPNGTQQVTLTDGQASQQFTLP